VSCIYKIFLPAYNRAKIILKKSIKIFQSYDYKCSATFLWFTVYISDIKVCECVFVSMHGELYSCGMTISYAGNQLSSEVSTLSASCRIKSGSRTSFSSTS